MIYSLTIEMIFFTLIPEAGLWGVRFFRNYKQDAIWFTEIFKLILKNIIWDINKTLILAITYIGILLKCFVTAHNKYSYIIIKTVINYNACCSLWFYCCAYALFFWSSYCHSSVYPWWTLIVHSPVDLGREFPIILYFLSI